VVPAGSHLNYVVNLLVRKGDYKIAVVGSPQVAKVDLLLNFRELIQTLRRNLEDGHETSSDESAYSGAVSMAINGPEGETPVFLDHIPKPVVTADRLTSEAPRLIASIHPVSTRLV